MATFYENLRSSNRLPTRGDIQSGKNVFQKSNPIMERRWENANWSGFEKDIDAGKIKGTDKYYENERNTVRAMDNIYADLSIKFQDYFYNKYYDSSKGDEEVPDDEILKESTEFIQDQVENTPLKNVEFDNGKSFYENFRNYGYDRNLLPDPNGKVSRLVKDGENREVPELRYDKVFPFKLEPYKYHERLGDKRAQNRKPI